jgi:UDP-glucose 4-epimerase
MQTVNNSAPWRATALVTGGGGYIGSHCVVALVESGIRCIVVDNLSNCYGGVAGSWARLLPVGSVKTIALDVRDHERLTDICLSEKVDVVIHFAALKSVPDSFAQARDYFDVNVAGSGAVIASALAAGTKLFVFSSSAAVYAAGYGSPLHENHPIGPSSPYGWTKALAERLFLGSSDDMRSVALRYFNPIGAHKSALIGEFPRSNLGNIAPSLCEAAESGRPLKVFGTDYPTADGSPVRDYLHVSDVAEAHAAAAAYLLNGGNTDVFNIGRGVGTTVLELHRIFCEVNQVRVPVMPMGRRAGDPASIFAQVDRARSVLNWTAKLGLADMCTSSWAWWLRRGDTYGDSHW